MDSSAWVGFFKVPGILLVRLMSRCNEKCLFCMVADEISHSTDLGYDEAVSNILAQPSGTLIEFFGGEPTIYPRFLDLLHCARTHGYPCSIASNVRIFHSKTFTRRVAELDPSKIYIRTSIYGDSSEIHDYYTSTKGSYAQTLKGLQNIVASGFGCQANVVIMKENYKQLARIAEQVHSWGVPRIKFGNLINVKNCADHAVSLALVKPHLQEAIQRAESLGLTVTVEKTPICVAGDRIDLISTERILYGSLRWHDDAGECNGCLVRSWCDGLDPDYSAIFGIEGLERINFIPKIALRDLESVCEPELLKMYCVGITDSNPDEQTLAALNSLWERVVNQHGELAIFPHKYLREAADAADTQRSTERR